MSIKYYAWIRAWDHLHIKNCNFYLFNYFFEMITILLRYIRVLGSNQPGKIYSYGTCSLRIFT